MPSRYVEDIAGLGMADAEEAGGKGANMGEMVAAGLPVPPGFVVLRDSYLESMAAAGVADELNTAHREAMLHSGEPGRFDEMCDKMQALVLHAGIPDDIRERIVVAYRAMGSNVNVAVRSSATGEDGADASFAGMNATFTNISGEPELIDAVQRCWASLFGARVVSYRASRGFSADPAMAVVVQQMIASERSGVAFTADPTTDETDRVVVEGAFGQARSWCPDRSSPTPTWSPRRPARSSPAESDTSRSRSSVAPTAPTRPFSSARPRPTPRCSTTTRSARSPTSRSAASGTRVHRRTPSGPSPAVRPGSCRPARSPPCTGSASPSRKPTRCCCRVCPPCPARPPAPSGSCSTWPTAAVCRTARCWWPR